MNKQDYFDDAYRGCHSDQNPYAWTRTPHTKCDLCRKQKQNTTSCASCKWEWGKNGVLKAWCVGCKYSANGGLDCLAEGSVCVCQPDTGYQFKIGPDGGLICLKDGNPVPIETAEAAVKAWLNNPQIRKPENVRLWESFVKEFRCKNMNNDGSYVALDASRVCYLMKSDFVKDPAGKIETIKQRFRETAEQEIERIDKWWKKETGEG